MIIGIDIDNTITDTLPILKQYCKRYNEEVLKRDEPINEGGFSTFNLYNWTKEENIDFCVRHLEEVVLQAKIKENAQEVIKKLKEEGNIIYIITARKKPEFNEPYKITERFLQDNGIVYDELVVGKAEKKQTCIDNKIDIMIDDEPQNINEISESIPVIAFDEIYNKTCFGKNVIKVNNWKQIYNIIKEMERR